MAIQTRPGAIVRSKTTSGGMVNGKKTVIIKKNKHEFKINLTCRRFNQNSRVSCRLKIVKRLLTTNTPDNEVVAQATLGATSKQLAHLEQGAE